MEISSILPIDNLRTLPAAEAYCVTAPRALAAKLDPALLDETELVRLQNFRQLADRERFLVAHSLKRKFLGALLGQDPAHIAFVLGKGNKPLLADGQCHFNLSHSGDWIALMVSLHAPVGIDVEQPSPNGVSVDDALVFHPCDSFHPASKDGDDRFYTNWTLKEAMSKCDGRGLDRPFNEIRLEPAEDGSYRGYHEETLWHANHFLLRDGAHLAYASETKCTPLHLEIG